MQFSRWAHADGTPDAWTKAKSTTTTKKPIKIKSKMRNKFALVVNYCLWWCVAAVLTGKRNLEGGNKREAPRQRVEGTGQPPRPRQRVEGTGQPPRARGRVGLRLKFDLRL